jgi:hypothetical protein
VIQAFSFDEHTWRHVKSGNSYSNSTLILLSVIFRKWKCETMGGKSLVWMSGYVFFSHQTTRLALERVKSPTNYLVQSHGLVHNCSELIKLFWAMAGCSSIISGMIHLLHDPANFILRHMRVVIMGDGGMPDRTTPILPNLRSAFGSSGQ